MSKSGKSSGGSGSSGKGSSITPNVGGTSKLKTTQVKNGKQSAPAPPTGQKGKK